MNNTEQKTVVGKTQVRVMRRDPKEINQIHGGIVVQDCGSFLRVFNPNPVSKGGDVNPESSELFPVAGRKIWCEWMTQRETAFPIPPVLR